MQGAVGLHDFAQIAVHAKAHAGVALVRLDMDIRCAVARSLREQGIEHADDGRVVGGFQQVFHGGQVLHHACQIGIRLDLADHHGGAGVALCIGRTDAMGQRGGVQQLPALYAMFALHFGNRRPVGLRAVPSTVSWPSSSISNWLLRAKA